MNCYALLKYFLLVNNDDNIEDNDIETGRDLIFLYEGTEILFGKCAYRVISESIEEGMIGVCNFNNRKHYEVHHLEKNQWNCTKWA